MLIRGLFFAFAMCLVAQAQAESLRQFHAESTKPVPEIAAKLQQQLPGISAPLGDNLFSVAYAGSKVPRPLVVFLESSFPQLDPALLKIGKTVSLSLTISGDESGTELALMIMANFPPSQAPVLSDSVVMMDGTGPGACEGHVVLQHNADQEATAKAYLTKFKSDGFVFPDAEPDEVSFFIGYAPDCQIALYLEPNPTTTMVVIRYLED